MSDRAIAPGSTIGILGGGQLGRMLALAAAELGFRTHIYCDKMDAPAFDVAAAVSHGDFGDEERISEFARMVDVVTYEFENVPVAAALAAASWVPVRPGEGALAASQDRIREKRFLADLGIPVAPFAQVDNLAGLELAAKQIGLPAILKTRRFGYDGKGQVRIKPGDNLAAAYAEIGKAPAVLEGLISFEREVSIVAARGLSGETAFYDVAENVHRDGILHTSLVPARISPEMEAMARDYVGRVLNALDYVGVIALELFHCVGETGGQLVANEIAPRVHNSGHWTQDACLTCQFENHIRAIAGWPLGATTRHSDAVMTNLIGEEVLDWRNLSARAGEILHLYGKRAARPGRKMGHINKITPRTAGAGAEQMSVADKAAATVSQPEPT